MVEVVGVRETFSPTEQFPQAPELSFRAGHTFTSPVYRAEAVAPPEKEST
jgi:hypothetical protein